MPEKIIPGSEQGGKGLPNQIRIQITFHHEIQLCKQALADK